MKKYKFCYIKNTYPDFAKLLQYVMTTFDNIISSGGRVLSVVAQGESFDNAFKLAYDKIEDINFDGMQFRKDIGYQIRNI